MAFGDIPDWTRGVSQSLLLALRSKDEMTFSHCVRVGHYSKLLAQAAGLNEYEQRVAEFAGSMHDIGKIGVPDHVLLKPGKLTAEEMAVMMDHARMSANCLHPYMHNRFINDVFPAVLHHHERLDGLGYPGKLRENEIPVLSKVIAVVDTFDAMTANRAYRRGLPEERVFQELKDHSGTQFDVELVKIFLQAYKFWMRAKQIQPPASPIPPAQFLHRVSRAA